MTRSTGSKRRRWRWLDTNAAAGMTRPRPLGAAALTRTRDTVNAAAGMTRPRPLGAAALAVALATVAAAAACGRDDALTDPVPTVPTVTAADSGAADNDEAASPDGDGSRGGDQTAADGDEAASPDGDGGRGGSQAPADGEDPTGPPLTAGETSDPPVAVFGDLDAAEVALETVIVLDAPIDMAVAPGDDLVWVAERAGRVLRVDLGRGEVAETVLDISDETTTDSERGLLGLAVTEGWLYVDYTDLDGHTRIEAFERAGSGLSGRRRLILSQEQPYSNHNGGAVRIGPDGYLYVGFGDGGSRGDPLNAGQDPFSWLGAILRIDPTPEAAEPYAVPEDNPFADGAEGRPEVFITGARNPWRFSFDAATGDLWVADVGQDDYEEVTLLLAANRGGAGANLGWRLREGLHPFTGDRPAGNVDPVWEYGRNRGCSVTGGHVYRGSEIADLAGAYVFGDLCASRLWAVSIAGGAVAFRDLGVDVLGGDLVSFGQDADGELYTLSLSGPIARIRPG